MEAVKEPNVKLLSESDFNPEKYVRDLSQNCVGGPELGRLRKKIYGLSEETNNNLKLNVYQNYMQFIDTAKEISNLESEMYQLSHLLSEQKSLLVALSNTSILDETVPTPQLDFDQTSVINKPQQELDDENHEKLTSILEKVEGCKDVINAPGRIYLYEGDLLEVDPIENTALLKTIHAHLFSDSFMTSIRNHRTSHSLMKYTFEAIYELASLAVVNVRDLSTSSRHQFKLLMFPESRVFQCPSTAIKKEWLDKFDQAKKSRLNTEKQQTKRDNSIVEVTLNTTHLSGTYSSFADYGSSEDQLPTVQHPQWFLEAAEELDVLVAQRHFEDAITLLEKSEHYISQFQSNLIYNSDSSNDKKSMKTSELKKSLLSSSLNTNHIIADMQRKMEQRHTLLTDVLMQELEVSPNKSLQGGLRAARRAVRLLNQLGHSMQSCNLFLQLCSSMMRIQCKRVKREGSTTIYIRRLSSVVFTNMCSMTAEFLRAFPESSNCTSAYVVWASSELTAFTSHFIKQVFMQQTSLSTLAECIKIVRTQCEKLCNFGIDLCYQLDGSLRAPVTQALYDARDKVIDSVKLRGLDDKWIPMNLRTKINLAKCLQEYSDLGLKLDSYVSGDIWLQLTPNTVAFTKLYISLFHDCMKLTTMELIHIIDEILYSVLEAQMRHCEAALRNENNTDQRQFIIKNAEFLLVTVQSLVHNKYTESIGFECSALNKIRTEYTAVLKGVSPSLRNTKTKYSSTEFL